MYADYDDESLPTDQDSEGDLSLEGQDMSEYDDEPTEEDPSPEECEAIDSEGGHDIYVAPSRADIDWTGWGE